MGKYISYIREKKLAKVTLALLCAVLLLGIYCFWNAFLYLPAKIFAAALIGFIAVIIILWITHYKLPKLSVCLEVVMVILLITASMAVNKVNTFTEKVTVTKEVEVVEIVALKDSKITAQQDFDDLILAYSQDDDQAYERSTEILKENGKKVAKEKPYKNMEQAYQALQKGNVDLLVLTNIGKSDLSMIDENYEQKIKVILFKEYEVESAKTKAVDISKDPFTIYFQGTDLSSGQPEYKKGQLTGDSKRFVCLYPMPRRQQQAVLQRLVGRCSVLYFQY